MESETQFDEPLARKALSHLLGTEEMEDSAEVEFTGGDICLDSPFHCGEAASSVLAAQAVVAADLSRLGRRGMIERILIDTRLAEASLVSFALQSFDDEERAPETRLSPEERTPAAGFFACRDGGVIYLHSSFPGYTEHSDAVLRLLGVPSDRESVAAAIAKRSASELEEEIASAGLCGAMLRTTDEWDESKPGQILAAVPVVELIKISDGPPQVLSPSGSQPLAGLRVVDLTRVLAGPVCARSLGSFGAEVLHIRGEGLPSVETFVADTGLGKRSAYLNLKSDSGREMLRSLVKQSDVFSQGYRSGVMERLGFGVNQLVELNPELICVSINCYGHEGQWRQRPGWEQLAQVVTGMAEHQGNFQESGSGLVKPLLQPSALNDYTTGYLAALGVMMAKRRQLLEGGGYLVRVSLCRTSMWIRGLGDRCKPVQSRLPEASELQGWYETFETAWGGLSALRPAVSLNGATPQWPGPPVPLGTHPASFENTVLAVDSVRD